jgi:hypothetical protein
MARTTTVAPRGTQLRVIDDNHILCDAPRRVVQEGETSKGAKSIGTMSLRIWLARDAAFVGLACEFVRRIRQLCLSP